MISLKSFPIDWDCNKLTIVGVKENVNDLSFGNRDASDSLIYSKFPKPLRGVKEWDNLFLNFRDSGQFEDGIHVAVVDQELTAEQAALIPDIPLPTEVCDGLDNDDNGQIDEGYEADGDGISDCFDNCPYYANSGQEDYDHDGFGDDCDLDGDNDGLTDSFEQARSQTNPSKPDTDGDGIPDAEEDDDVDGLSNELEQMAGTNPVDGSSFPRSVNVTVNLEPGFNSINLPIELSFLSVMTPDIFMIGGPEEVDRVLRHDPTTGQVLQAFYDNYGQPDGDTISLRRDQGLIVYAKASKSITYSLLLECPTYDLRIGLNHIGFPCIAEGTTAFQLLENLGGEAAVSSIQRYNKTTGQFETAAYENGQIVGADFPIIPGEGYFVFMKQDKPGFRP